MFPPELCVRVSGFRGYPRSPVLCLHQPGESIELHQARTCQALKHVVINFRKLKSSALHRLTVQRHIRSNHNNNGDSAVPGLNRWEPVVYPKVLPKLYPKVLLQRVNDHDPQQLQQQVIDIVKLV